MNPEHFCPHSRKDAAQAPRLRTQIMLAAGSRAPAWTNYASTWFGLSEQFYVNNRVPHHLNEKKD